MMEQTDSSDYIGEIDSLLSGEAFAECPLTLDEYQLEALTTAIYPNCGENIIYPLLGLLGEVGELANKYKKVIRDSNGILSPEKRLELIAELGDTMWYEATLAHELHVSLSEVCEQNLAKLRKRKEANTLKGSGDNR